MKAADCMQNEEGNGLPEGWLCTQFGNVVWPSKNKIEPHQKPEARYLGLEHIEAYTSKILGGGRASEVKSTKSVFKAGDVLYGKLRPYLNKVAAPDFDGVCSTDFIVFDQKICLNNRFLLWFLLQREVVEYANHNSTGVELPRISYGKLASLDFLLPPLAEQHRIVARIEKCLTRVNSARNHLSQIPAILKRFRQAVLVAACSGRLTEDWRTVNGVVDSYREFILEEIADFVGGYAYKSPGFTSTGTHQVIRIGNIRPMALNLSASPVFISDQIAKETVRFRLSEEDIVLSMTGTKFKRDYGFAAMVHCSSDLPLFLNQRVGRLRCKPCILPLYLLYFLQTESFREFFFRGETGNVNQGNVGADGIRKAPISLPTILEQHEIVRRAQTLLRWAQSVEGHLSAATLRSDKLTQSILAKAFRGELVPVEAELARREGREYEPASVLLERIRKERGADASTKPERKRTNMKSKLATAKG
jgi:type I restriction enzyme S subunit